MNCFRIKLCECVFCVFTRVNLFVLELVFCFLCISPSLVSGCQYQCNQLPGKTHLRNDLLCVKRDIKPYLLTDENRNWTPLVNQERVLFGQVLQTKVLLSHNTSHKYSRRHNAEKRIQGHQWKQWLTELTLSKLGRQEAHLLQRQCVMRIQCTTYVRYNSPTSIEFTYILLIYQY